MKKAGEKAGRNSRGLVAQPHGGALWAGPPANPVAGSGRPPSQVKEALRLSFADRVAVLADIADGVVTVRLRHKCPECGYEGMAGPLDQELEAGLRAVATPAERTRALDVMARHSDLSSDKLPDPGLFRELAAAVVNEVPDPEIWRRIEPKWIESLSRRIG